MNKTSFHIFLMMRLLAHVHRRDPFVSISQKLSRVDLRDKRQFVSLGFPVLTFPSVAREKNSCLDRTNLADLNEKLKAEVKTIYGQADKFDLLLLLAIQGWTPEDVWKFLTQDTTRLYVSELQNSGLLFLVDGRYFVPPILLQSLAGDFQVAIKQILAHFPNRMLSGMFTASDFEEFCIGFFTLKRNLLVSQGIQKIPIVEFFKGAWISPDIANRMITLAEDGAKQSAAIMYRVQTASLDSLEKVKIAGNTLMNARNNIPVALWIGNNDPHQDGVILLPDTLIQFEMKYTIGDAQQALTGASPSSFESEQRKAESSPLRLADGSNVFVYITNCRMTNDVEKRKLVQHAFSIIVNADNFKDVFPPTFEYVTSRIKSPLIASVEEILPAASSEDPLTKSKPKKEPAISKKNSESNPTRTSSKATKPKKSASKSGGATTAKGKRKSRDNDSEEEKRESKRRTTKK